MEQFNYVFTDKDMAALKVTADYEHKNNVEYSKIVLKKIEVLMELMDSLFQEKIQIPNWQIWAESLIIKFSFHSVSMIKMFDGIELPVKRNGKHPVVLDEPSIIILFRVILENYLTFSYLYCNKISDEEKQFRLAVWRYSGINQRANFEISTDEAKTKQANEKNFLTQLKKEIEESNFFNSFNAGDKKLILKGVKPRLFNSWMDIVRASGLRERFFKNLYGYKSNYSHSEFISALQINSKDKPFQALKEIHYTVFLLHLLVCKTIIDLKSLFPTIQDLYTKLDKDLINEIEFLNVFVGTEIMDKI